jgi:hypothetical protein
MCTDKNHETTIIIIVPMMRTRHLAAITLLQAIGGPAVAAVNPPPNLIILTDDQGYHDNNGLIGREDQAINFDAGSQRELGRRYAQMLLAINLAASVPPPLGLELANGQLALNWPSNYTGWRLQAQRNDLALGLSTNWTEVSGFTATNRAVIPLSTTNGAVFFRLMQP